MHGIGRIVFTTCKSLLHLICIPGPQCKENTRSEKLQVSYSVRIKFGELLLFIVCVHALGCIWDPNISAMDESYYSHIFPVTLRYKAVNEKFLEL